MESKWYFFPGQTVGNTKISDRAHALHITQSSWKGITHHLDRKKRIQQVIDKEKAHRDALKEGSHRMTKEWINSIENLRLKKEGERRDRMDKKKENKIQLFYEMREEQEVVRKQYVDKIKKEIFLSGGYPKELTSALILSETLNERDKQLEFNVRLRKHDEELKNKTEEEILKMDQLHVQEDKEQKSKKIQKEQEVAKILKDQITENEETRKALNRSDIEQETLARINAAKEAELLKQFEIDEKIRKRQEIALGRKKAIDTQRKRQQVLAKEEAEMEKATQFYSEAKKRIDCLMKTKEKNMREESIKKREEIAKNVATIQENKDAAENARLAQAIAERDAEEKAKLEAKAQREAQAIQDRIEDRNKYFERREKEKYIDDEMKRWEMLNRCKAEEAMKEYNEQNRRDKWAKILEYRRDLLEQMADEKEIRIQEKEIDEIMSRVSFEETDKMFFSYADEVLELAKRKNRLTYPIEKVINEYKKSFGLLKKERLCRCCKK